MAATADKIPDRQPFDVYAMMMILAFVFIGLGTWMLYDNLTKVWGYGYDPANAPQKAEHITVTSDKHAQDPNHVNLTAIDLKEYPLCADGATVNLKDIEWPQGYDPITNPVKEGIDNTKLP